MPLHVLQLVRYLGVGVAVNSIGYVLFLVLLLAGMNHKLSASITYLGGALASFLLNRTLVFQSTTSLRTGLARLCVMLVSGYALNISMLYIGVDVMTLPASVVQLFSIVCVSAFFYVANKCFVHGDFTK